MNLGRRTGLEASLDGRIELLDSRAEFRFLFLFEGTHVALSIRAAREALYQDPPDEEIRRAIWREAILRFGDCPETGNAADWRVILTWLAFPGVRRTVRQISERFGVDRDDVEAETALAVLAALEAVDPESPSIGGDLLRFCRGKAWAYGRRFSREHSCGDLATMAADQIDSCPSARNGVKAAKIWPVLPSLVHSDEVAPRTSSTVLRQRVEGERIGSIAERLGLREIVLSRLAEDRGRLVGRLFLHPEDGRR
ncbi:MULTISPECIES: hypothetical protein [Streptomycetaceae]|uniref:hypothetical protein n=1 Tax=Streptomycetaceae TaxID=2062 RepID=UPI0011612E4D|nr:hypothetical protein [Streptomyces sp. CB02056]